MTSVQPTLNTQPFNFESGSGLSRNGNVIRTERYDITVTRGEVKVLDRQSNTFVRAWGDPHLHTSDGDKAQFHRDNLTLQLQDGTKITIKPTSPDARGLSFIDEVAVMNGNDGMLVRNVRSGPVFDPMTRVPSELDRRHVDGTVLRAGAQIDDLFFTANGREMIGGDPTQRFGEHMLDGVGGAERSSSLENIPAGNIYAVLWAIMSELDEMMLAKVNRLKELKEQLGDDENANVEGEIEKITFELQRLKNLKAQLSGAATNLMQTDHQSKMNVINNMRA